MTKKEKQHAAAIAEMEIRDLRSQMIGHESQASEEIKEARRCWEEGWKLCQEHGLPRELIGTRP